MSRKINDLDDLGAALLILMGHADVHGTSAIRDALVEHGGMSDDWDPKNSTINGWFKEGGAEAMSDANFRAFTNTLIELGVVVRNDANYKHLWLLKSGHPAAISYQRSKGFAAQVNELYHVQITIAKVGINPAVNLVEKAILLTKSAAIAENLEEEISRGEEITPHLISLTRLFRVKVWSDKNEIDTKSHLVPLGYKAFEAINDFSKLDAIQFSSCLAELCYLSGYEKESTRILKRIVTKTNSLTDERAKTAVMSIGDYLMEKTEMSVSVLSDMADDKQESDLLYKYGGADRCKACKFIGVNNSIAREYLDEARRKAGRLKEYEIDATVLNAYLDTLELICDWRDGIDPSQDLIDRITQVYLTARQHNQEDKPLVAGLLHLRIQVMEELSTGTNAERFRTQIFADCLAINHHLTGSVHAFCMFDVPKIIKSAGEISERAATGQIRVRNGREV